MNIEVHHYVHLDAHFERIALGKLDRILEGINTIMVNEKEDVAAVVAAVADVKQAALDMEARVDEAIANATGPNASLEQATSDLQALKSNFAGFHQAIDATGTAGAATGDGGASSSDGAPATTGDGGGGTLAG